MEQRNITKQQQPQQQPKKKLNQFIDKMSIAMLTLTFISSSAPSKNNENDIYTYRYMKSNLLQFQSAICTQLPAKKKVSRAKNKICIIYKFALRVQL